METMDWESSDSELALRRAHEWRVPAAVAAALLLWQGIALLARLVRSRVDR